MRRRALGRHLAAAFLAGAIHASAVSAVARAGVPEGFEGPTVSGRAAAADAAYRLVNHQRVDNDVHSGRGAERIQIVGSDGSYVHFAYDVPPARIVAELVPSVWVKSNRPGIQILARVVLPHTTDPRTGGPAAVLLRGTSYTLPGAWQELRIVEMPLLLSRQVRVLRVEIGPQVDAREAYIDQVLVNVYGGPGETSVTIDDLELSGAVPREAVEQASHATGVGASGSAAATVDPVGRAAPRQVSVSGATLLVDRQPFFPRIIQWQGEPLAWLAQLGFNAAGSQSPLTQEMLRDANRAGIWLIGPPPQVSGPAGASDVGQISAAYEPVLAWHLGTGLAARELTSTGALSKQLRQAGGQISRPLLCGAEEELRSYSRHVDVLFSQRFPLASSLELDDYGAWLRQRPQLARPGTPIWTVVQTEPPPELVAQVSAFVGPASRAGPSALTIDPDALRLLAYQTFASGARGIEFASSSRLDATDLPGRLRSLSLALLNQEFALLEPWGAAGSYVTQVASSDRSVQGVVLHTDSARVVLAMRCSQGSQYLPSPQTFDAAPGVKDPSFIVPGVPESHNVYELTPAGLRPLRHKRVAGGMSITLEDFLLTSAVLITPDPLVVNSMSQRAAQGAQRAARMQRDLAAAMLEQVEQVSVRLASGPIQLPPAADSIGAARGAIQRADQMLAVGDYGRAYFAARNATLPLDRWKRDVWERSIKTLRPPASPLAASFDTLPEHLAFLAQLSRTPPAANVLIGGDCEDLSTMTGAGWRHYEHPQPEIQTAVELSPLAPYNGGFSLRMQARSSRPEAAPAVVETPPLWITSAPVRVEAGDVLCVQGQVRITGPISGSVDGLMIVDSMGGQPLAERMGPTNGWKEFVMYRAAPHTGDLSVTFALTGLGEAWIDDVTIRLVRRQ